MKICFDAHRADGRVWCVQVGRKWLNAARIDIRVPVITVYKPRAKRQPKAWLEPTWPGAGVRQHGEMLIVEFA